MSLIASDHFRIVVGLGKSGMSLVRFLARQGLPFAVADSRANPPELATLRAEFPQVDGRCGELDVAFLCRANELLVSPGLALATPALQQAAARGVKMSGDIELFARNAKAPIIAITGSNAKSTVTTLVGEMAAAAGKRVAVGGNLGTPALDLLNDEVELYVLELSSFQLECTDQLNAEVATCLNVSEDHMDRYSGMPAYHLAKHRIFRGARQVVINRQDALSRPLLAEGQPCWSFGLNKPDFKAFGLIEEGGEKYLAFQFDKLLNVRELKIRGAHNQANALAALALGHAAGLPMAPMLAALREFTGLAHRCQWLRELRGVGLCQSHRVHQQLPSLGDAAERRCNESGHQVRRSSRCHCTCSLRRYRLHRRLSMRERRKAVPDRGGSCLRRAWHRVRWAFCRLGLFQRSC